MRISEMAPYGDPYAVALECRTSETVNFCVDERWLASLLYNLGGPVSRSVTVTLTGATMAYESTPGRIVRTDMLTMTGNYEWFRENAKTVTVRRSQHASINATIRVRAARPSDNSLVGELSMAHGPEISDD